MTISADTDVVDLLLRQHRQVEDLLDQIPAARGQSKQEHFQDLVRLLAIHESAEEQFVHPAARKTAAGDEVVDARLAEENEAKHVLTDLHDLGVDHADFDRKFAAFANAVREHAEHEENDEFPALRAANSPTDLHAMAERVERAEKLAPTRPHPHAGESAAANMLAGPPLAVFDRIRDALRHP
ncbi:hemerythrin domain-containing protein [Nocardia sp. BMG111209]|uniref:hemerythrin domain-containing protein n=1 Tax=Nocardia sp. BMG111209 TaxID=1160137 RepID=UPI00035E36B5|nr:hemerythrin domain-containing protein [Nocardia sp. BMG111209]